ncbi:MAG: MMPL family transporter [Acidobacteriota bacterium]
MREALLTRIALFCARHYRGVFAAASVLGALALLLFTLKPPRIESDILDLLPRKNPAVQDFRQATEDFKSLDYLFVLLETADPQARPISEYEEYADQLAEAIRETGLVESVEYRLHDFEGMVQALLPYTLLYLSPESLPEVADRFTDEAVHAQVEDNRKLISNPASLVTKQLVQYDPFGLFPILKRNFAGKTRQLKVDLSDGYYLSRDGTALLMIVRPKKPAQNIPFGKDLMARVRSAEKALRQRWVADGEEGLEALTVRYGGGYPIAQDDADLIKRDAVINTATSAVLVMGVFLWAFRRKSALAYGWMPLLFGILMTFAAVHLMGIHLNSATAGFAALLIGLGIDFSTVIYGRYVEERNAGRGSEESIATALGRTGKGVFVGAVTTSCTFGAMIVTEFTGMRQVGVFTSVGILLSAASVFFLLPAMLQFHQVHKEKRATEPSFHMHAFWVDGIARAAHRRPWTTLLIAAGLTAVFGLFALGIRLDDNIKNLRSSRNRGINVSSEIAKKFGASLTYMMVLLESASPEGIVADAEKVTEAVQPFVKTGDILFTDSPSTYLPPVERQRAVVEELRRQGGAEFSFTRIRRTFLASCRQEGFNPEFFREYLVNLGRMLRPEGPLTYDQIRRTPLGPVLDKFIVEKAPGRYRGVVYLYMSEEFRRFEPSGLIEAVRDRVPEAKVVGINVFSKALRTLIKRDALIAFLVGNLVVLLIVAADFRSFRMAAYALVPLCVAMVWMLGSLAILGEPLNLMNIFVTTLILGIGSDYGIYFVHRHREPDGAHMDRVIQEVGSPIVIAALTTIAGFGSMVTSSYPGLRSIGYVSLLGTVYSMVTTLTVLVALLTLWDRRRQAKGPADPAA